MRFLLMSLCATLALTKVAVADTITFTFDAVLPFSGVEFLYPEEAEITFPATLRRPYTVALNDQVGALQDWRTSLDDSPVFEVQFEAFSNTVPDYVISATSGGRDTYFHDVFLRFDRALTLLDYRLSAPHVSDSWDLVAPGSSRLLLGVSTPDGFGVGRYDGPMTVTAEVSPVPLPATGAMMAGGLGLLGLWRRKRRV